MVNDDEREPPHERPSTTTDAHPPDQPDRVEAATTAFGPGSEVRSAPSHEGGRYRLKTAHELVNGDALEWRVKRVLPSRGLAQIYGESRAGKSFLVLDLAAAIVEGRSWFDRRVAQAPVVYVGLEGESGLRQRVQAWEAHHQRPFPPTLRFFVGQPFDIRHDASDLAASVEPGSVVFIDTQNRAAPDADENSSRDMGAILQGAKLLHVRTSGLVVLVTHKAKHAEPGKGPRGHSSQLAAMDAVLEVTRSSNNLRSWRVEKAKDAEDGGVHGFRLDVVSLGIDADGDEVSSCVVVPTQDAHDAAASASAASKLSTVARQAFLKVRGEDGFARIDDWRSAFRDLWAAQSAQAKTKAFERARKELRERGEVEESGDRVTFREANEALTLGPAHFLSSQAAASW